MITIHGTGCCLIDFLYPKTDFSAPAFREKLSRKDGDGGLAVGKLVFAENFEKFVNIPYESALKEIAGGTPSHNLGGACRRVDCPRRSGSGGYGGSF
jgi:hypothetical protein